MKKTILRTSVDLFLLVSIFLFPWWFPLALAVACLFLFENFLEILLVGFLLDVLYGIPGATFFKTNMLFTFISAATLAISFFAKRNLSMYSL